MATPYAFVTLVTSDSYLPGALAQVAALREVHPQPAVHPEVDFQTVCVVTPETVDISSIKLLRKSYDLVVGVEIIEQNDDKGLQLLGRLDLNTVLTKLHIFRLTQYSKIIFLDADVLPIRPLSHLFNLPHEFSAVPDVGWPDIFNSGVLVFAPGEDKFEEIRELLKSKGTWDGGDQGILNEWRGSNWHRLSFVYNTTPTAAYTYAPAYERFGAEISAIHFIGPNKPWKFISKRAPGMKSTERPESGPQQTYDYVSLLDRWFEVYDRHYRSTTHTTVSDFQVQRYVSVWENTGDIGAQLQAMTPANAWGLDELKKVALQGLSSSGRSSRRPEEGEYRSLPLDGRLDLMGPRKIENSDQRTEGEPSGHTALFADTPGDAQESAAELSGMNSPGHQQISSLNYTGPTTYNLDHSTRPTGPLDGGFSAGTKQFQPYPNSQFPGQIPAQTPSTPLQRTVHHGHLPLQASPHFLQAQLQSPERFQASQFYSNLHFQQSLAQSQQTSKSAQVVQLHSSLPLHQLSPAHLRGSSKLVSNSPRRSYHPSYQEEPYHSPRSHRRHLLYEPTHSPVEGRDESDSLVSGTGQQSPQQQFKEGPHSPISYSHTQHGPPSPRSQRQSLNLQQTGTVSPPKVPWNPAVEPPPHSPSQQHDATFQTFSPPPSSPRTLRSEVFFHPPPPSAIPEHLIKEGQYSGVLGPIDSQDAKGDSPSTPMPDKGKVKSVFPWEEKPRHVPRRVFPATDASPPSAHYIEEELAASPPKVSPVHEPDRPRRIPAHFTIPPVPTSLTSPNVWDTVPSIQRYASRLVRPSDVFPQPVIAPPENGWRKWEKMRERDWQEHQDASSMDGDDEDDGDDDDDLSETEDKNRSGKDRQRRGSSGSATRVKKEYRVRGVQTVSREKVEEEVQVSILHAQSVDGKVTSLPIIYQGQLTSQGVGIDSKDDWPPSASASSLLPPAVLRDPNVEPEQVIGSPTVISQSTLPFPSMAAPTGTRSPVLISPRSYSPPKAASLPKATSPSKVGSPRVSFARPLHGSRRVSTSSPSVSPALRGSPRGVQSPPPASPRAFSTGCLHKPSTSLANTVSRSQQTTPPPKYLSKLSSPFSPQMQRSASTETTATISPSTTHSSTLDTPENTPVLGPRKASRVWDPARGIDVFKRGSEEVLARFLRMGSFEEEAQKRPAA